MSIDDDLEEIICNSKLGIPLPPPPPPPSLPPPGFHSSLDSYDQQQQQQQPVTPQYPLLNKTRKTRGEQNPWGAKPVGTFF